MTTNIAEVHENVLNFLLKNYPDLTFYIRQEDEEFKQHKWFLGNDTNVIISFWKDIDNKGMPIFSFIINIAKNECFFYAILQNELGEEQTDQNKIFQINTIATKIKAVQISSKGTSVWQKNYPKYENDGYLQILKNFIATDKEELDWAIEFIWKERKNISKQEFDMNLHRIEQYKNKGELLSNTNTRILLDNLALKNFKTFNYANISFHKNLTVVIGKNGTGKTSLLKAIVYGISSTVFKTNFNLKNFVKLPKKGQFENNYYGEATISLQSSKRDFAQTSTTTISSYNGAIPTFSNKSLWLSSYNSSYFQDEILEQLVFCCSQNRQENDNSYTNYNIKKPRIEDLESFLNGVLYNGFNDFEGWIRSIKNEIDSAENNKLIVKIFEVISSIIGEPISVDVNTYDRFFIKYENFDKKMPIGLMSDGEKNIIGWVGYFMLRLWEVSQDWHKERQLEPQHEFWEHPALVLIDEIDTYLHPQWQSTIMAVLVEKFPNVQFVITTHSPYVVGSVPSDKIKIYTCDKNEEGEVDVTEFTGFTAYGADIKELSARLYGNIERPVKAIQEMFVDLFADLEQFENEPNYADLEQKIKATIADLESKIHAADPELISAKSQLAMIQTLNEMEKEGVK